MLTTHTHTKRAVGSDSRTTQPEVFSFAIARVRSRKSTHAPKNAHAHSSSSTHARRFIGSTEHAPLFGPFARRANANGMAHTHTHATRAHSRKRKHTRTRSMRARGADYIYMYVSVERARPMWSDLDLEGARRAEAGWFGGARGADGYEIIRPRTTELCDGQTRRTNQTRTRAIVVVIWRSRYRRMVWTFWGGDARTDFHSRYLLGVYTQFFFCMFLGLISGREAAATPTRTRARLPITHQYTTTATAPTTAAAQLSGKRSNNNTCNVNNFPRNRAVLIQSFIFGVS